MEADLNLFSGTIAPWLLGTFFTLSFIAFLIAVKNWREMKRSPYFFQRLQAGKRLQTYISTSFFLFLIAIGVTTYSWQSPQDSIQRKAILTHSKPREAEVVVVENAYIEPIEGSVEEAIPFSLNDTELPGSVLTVADQPFTAAGVELPAEYNRLEPTVELNSDSELGVLVFSTEVTENYEAVNPQAIFGEGFFRVYATFSYDGLADGMVWSWVWRHDGAVVEGGHEIWNYGDSGPGFIYLEPEEGFQAGRYSLEVWVNGELMTQGVVTMNAAAVSANN